ncbi:MAG: radical SAM mobile pair protein B [Clostridia bacterium]|nr:radical SAM mobile pair protein B [Clostridia bacterium]
MTVKEIQVNGIITKSNLPACEYSVNPYVGCEHACKYCYACFMKRFTGHGENWGEFIDVKYWQPIKNPKKYGGRELFIGSVTDPYQPAEEKYKRTRALLEELQGSGALLSVATKSDLILRDLDLIKTFPNARVSWSVNTLDERFKNDMDKGVSVERRLAAMKAFHDAGVRTTCFISPIFPEITDVKAIVKRVKSYCNLIWLENLNLRGAFKPAVMQYIKNGYAELLPLYNDIYVKGSESYWQALDAELQAFAAEQGLEYRINDDTFTRPFDEPPVMVNYFYHSKIKKSARKEKR